MDILRGAYTGDINDAFTINVSEADNAEVERATGNKSAEVYGEILPASIKEMLDHLGAKPGQKYYDLGSGNGKTVVLAWALGLDATGIELSAPRYAAACDAVGRLRNSDAAGRLDSPLGLRFVHGNVLDADVSDADIIFADNLCFNDDVQKKLARVIRGARQGTRVVSASVLPGLSHDFSMKLPTSWSDSTPYHFQTVGDPSNETYRAGSATPLRSRNRSVSSEAARRLGRLWRRALQQLGWGEMAAKSITRPAMAGTASPAGGAMETCELGES